MNKKEMVTVIIPIRNEEKYIEKCLESILAQTYSKQSMEILLVDGESEDNTKYIIEKFQKENPSMIRIYNNTRKIIPVALNLGIKNARGKFIIRMDAHTIYQSDYIEQCIAQLEITGADNVGGIIDTKSVNTIGNAISYMLSSKFGVGDSGFRTNAKDGYVDTVPFGAFRRELFDRIGFYDERLIRNEDNEFNYRIRKSGGKIFLCNSIKSSYYCRSSLYGILKMGYENGKWNIATSKICPGSMSLRHFIPLLFLLSILFLPIVFFAFDWSLLRNLFYIDILAYGVLDLYFTLKIIKNEGICYLFILIFLFPLFHLVYGYGSLVGILTINKI